MKDDTREKLQLAERDFRTAVASLSLPNADITAIREAFLAAENTAKALVSERTDFDPQSHKAAIGRFGELAKDDPDLHPYGRILNQLNDNRIGGSYSLEYAKQRISPELARTRVLQVGHLLRLVADRLGYDLGTHVETWQAWATAGAVRLDNGLTSAERKAAAERIPADERPARYAATVAAQKDVERRIAAEGKTPELSRLRLELNTGRNALLLVMKGASNAQPPRETRPRPRAKSRNRGGEGL